MRLKRWGQWLLAATVVFQLSATVGARMSPPETLTAVRVPHSASGR